MTETLYSREELDADDFVSAFFHGRTTQQGKRKVLERLLATARHYAPRDSALTSDPWFGYRGNWIAPFHACPRCKKSLNWVETEDAVERGVIRAQCCTLIFAALLTDKPTQQPVSWKEVDAWRA